MAAPFPLDMANCPPAAPSGETHVPGQISAGVTPPSPTDAVSLPRLCAYPLAAPAVPIGTTCALGANVWIDTNAPNGRYPTNVENVGIGPNATYGAIRELGDNVEVGSVGTSAT